ncbi:MAG: signal peptidase I [Gammaproteobacteria bacterium]|nr:signal peptidase I [Gammaproteobacteria bacterium]
MFKVKKLLQQNKGFILFIILMSVFRSAIADWNSVPSGSMKPTIEIGDRIGINKLAYDIKIPFINHSLLRLSEPQRGDIIVFESKAADTRMVKRVIGQPGDRIAMINNQLIINGQPVQYIDQTSNADKLILSENLPNNPHLIALIKDRASRYDSFDLVVVPPDSYLVLGDNRRNSSDSRVYGFIPRAEIIGRAENVVLSFNPDNYFIPRANRVWQPLL